MSHLACFPPSKPAAGVCDTLGDKVPPFTAQVARQTIDPDPFPNFTWVNPSMVVSESIPDGGGGHSSSDPIAAELYTPSDFAASSDFSLLSFGNPQFMSTSPPSILSRESPCGSAPDECAADVLRDSVRSLDEGEEDPIYTFPPCWIAAFDDSAIYLRERKAEMTQTIPEDDEALVRTTIRSLDAGEEPVFDLPSGWKDVFSLSPSPLPEVAPPSLSRPDAAEKSSVLPRLKSLWKRAASKFAPRHV